jgi:hypothetical protein
LLDEFPRGAWELYKEDNMPPDFLLEKIGWSFKEPIPDSIGDFIEAVEN